MRVVGWVGVILGREGGEVVCGDGRGEGKIGCGKVGEEGL